MTRKDLRNRGDESSEHTVPGTVLKRHEPKRKPMTKKPLTRAARTYAKSLVKVGTGRM